MFQILEHNFILWRVSKTFQSVVVTTKDMHYRKWYRTCIRFFPHTPGHDSYSKTHVWQIKMKFQYRSSSMNPTTCCVYVPVWALLHWQAGTRRTPHMNTEQREETKKTSTPQVANMCTTLLYTCGVCVCARARTCVRVALDETYGSSNIKHKAIGTHLFTVSLTALWKGEVVQIFGNKHNKSKFTYEEINHVKPKGCFTHHQV
jgi:hypothetical protein